MNVTELSQMRWLRCLTSSGNWTSLTPYVSAIPLQMFVSVFSIVTLKSDNTQVK